MSVRSRWPWVLGLSAVTIGATWLAQPWLSERGLGWDHVAQRLPSTWEGFGQPSEPLRSVTAPEPEPLAQAMTPDQVRQRLFQEGSLVGTEPAGDWCVNAQPQLQPCEALRQRFEYYILGLGEVGIADIRALLQEEARLAHGPALADQIMAIFDKYWQIRTHDWKSHFVQSDRSTWMPVFEEQRAVRRQILGQAWADAFFQEEEQHFQAYYAQLESGEAPPADPGEPVPEMAPGKDPQAIRVDREARYGSEAADRLDKVDAQWTAWEQRLSAARAEWARLQTAPQLSDLQRQQDMQRYVDTHFQGNERVRAKALLKL